MVTNTNLYMKKLIFSLAFAFVTVFAFAQTSKVLRPRIEIAQVETEDIKTVAMEVFYMNDESPRTYYLSLGNLSIGGHIVSIEVDPLFELFIPLGNTLDEAIAKMEEIKAMYKMPKLSTAQIKGNFALAYPTDELIDVTVTRRQLVTARLLEFSIPTPGSETVVRNTHITKSNFSSLLGSLKIYRKLHPKEL